MKILYVTQYFPPETGAGSRRAEAMAGAWAEMGHDVTVVCPFPNYPDGKVDSTYFGKAFVHDTLGRVKVLRVPILVSPKKTFLARLGGYASFAASGTLGALLRSRPDLVYVTSPPLPVGLAALLSSFRQSRVVFEVRDLWPESAVVLGELSNPSLISAATRFEEWCYARADRIVAATDGIRKRLVERGIPKAKIIHSPNGADLARFGADFRPIDTSGHGLKLFYGGLLGLAQAVPTMLEAAENLQDMPGFRFTMAGGGSFKTTVESALLEKNLDSTLYMGTVEPEQIPKLIAEADLCLVPLSAEPLFAGAVPSKLYEAWAAGRPVLLSARGEAARLVTQTGGGVVVPPEDPGSFAQAVKWLARNRPGLARMGMAGKEAVSRFDRRVLARKLLEELTAKTE